MSTALGTAYVDVKGDFTTLNKGLAAVLGPTRMSKLGKAGGVALAGAVAAAGIGKALYDVGEEFDAAYDKIRVGTGATGKQFRRLRKDFDAVITSVPAEFDDAGKAIAGLNTRLGLTGKPLRQMSRQILELSRITETDLEGNIRSVARAFVDWEVPVKRQSKALDGLFRLGQKSGASVSELGEAVQRFGSPLRQLGFSFAEASSMFAVFERAGVNMQTMVPGFKLAISRMSDPTEELAAQFQKLDINARKPEVALRQVFELLSDESSLSDIKKRSLAMDVFGQRAGSDMKEAISQGRFELDEMLKVFRRGDSIRKAGKDTMDFNQSWLLFKNNLKNLVKPVAKDVFKKIGDWMGDLSDIMSDPKLTGQQKFNKIIGKFKDVGVDAAKGLVRAFIGADIWGKLFLGGLIVRAIGGRGAVRRLGGRLGGWLIGALVARFLAGAAATTIGTKLRGKLAPRVKNIGRALGTMFSRAFVAGAVAYIVHHFRHEISEAIADAMPGSQPGESSTRTEDPSTPGFDVPLIDRLGDLFRASGGPVASGRPYIVGERGPEMFVPKRSGDIVPNHKLGISALLGDESRKARKPAKELGEHFERIHKKGKKQGEELEADFGKSFKKLHRDTTKRADDTRKRVSDRFGRMNKDSSRQSEKMRSSVSRSFRSLTSNVTKGLGIIGTQTNKALKALGVKTLNFGISTSGRDKKARGGFLSGRGRQDTVPILAAPGEAVLNRHQQVPVEHALRTVYGGGLDDLFRSVKRPHYMAKGGWAGTSPGGLSSGVKRVALWAMGRYGASASSTLRPGDDGHHGTGHAVDLVSGNMKQMALGIDRAYRPQLEELIHTPLGYGIKGGQKVPPYAAADHYDHVHVAVLGAVAKEAMDRIKKVTLTGPNGPLKSMGQASLDKVRKAANAYIAKKSATQTGQHGLMSGDGNVERIFAKVARKLSDSKIATLALGMAGYAESGMRDLSYGHSTSQGALQLLASTASGMGINPHDEAAVASAFLLRGFYGRGGANKLANQGLPAHLVAQNVQGSAFSSGSNYKAQTGAAKAWMRRFNLARGGLVPSTWEGRHPGRSVRMLRNLDNLTIPRIKRLMRWLEGVPGVGELLGETLAGARTTRTIRQLQAPVLADFMPPYGGSFANGGVVPGPKGAPRTVIAHGGEGVGPAVGPEGVKVIVHGDIVSDRRDPVEVVLGDRRFPAAVQKANRAQARRNERRVGVRR